ncbi:nucleotidyltransferase domain-containing protein [Sporichthya sp.]|uniref:nucleotidyltransferase domain-containing protein n=1 Tax=Sporichthya sp. TaxID=65475 RepID=UPI001818C4E7|nr:nucleotidyltransferase domain-containing protein [Sporichthya sp.]MBA3742297.1 nucleotidyltransferase domain-containing protein [Sporichthya sp.]
MDLASPISSVVPTAHGAALFVLARADQPLSGRQIAALTNGRFGQWRINEVLGELADSGIVLREHRPPAKLYRLNRDHVAAPGIEALAAQRDLLIERMRFAAGEWAVPADALWLFGSAARGDGGPGSDVDLLVIRASSVGADDQHWLAQLDQIADQVSRWCGNHCEVLELSRAELEKALARGDRLTEELRADAVGIAGATPRSLLRRPRPVAAS